MTDITYYQANLILSQNTTNYNNLSDLSDVEDTLVLLKKYAASNKNFEYIVDRGSKEFTIKRLEIIPILFDANNINDVEDLIIKLFNDSNIIKNNTVDRPITELWGFSVNGQQMYVQHHTQLLQLSKMLLEAGYKVKIKNT